MSKHGLVAFEVLDDAEDSPFAKRYYGEVTQREYGDEVVTIAVVTSTEREREVLREKLGDTVELAHCYVCVYLNGEDAAPWLYRQIGGHLHLGDCIEDNGNTRWPLRVTLELRVRPTLP